MEQSGEYRIGASRETVWTALNDPDVLGSCIDGVQHIAKIDDEHFDLAVKAKVGPVNATFQAALELSDLNPPASYVISGNAKGGAAGFAKGSATVNLEEESAEVTVLRYGVNANVGGKLAQIGSRLVEGTARKMADDFFAAFSQHLDPNAVASEAEGAAASETTAAEAGPVQSEGNGQWLIWAIAFGVLAIAVILAV